MKAEIKERIFKLQGLLKRESHEPTKKLIEQTIYKLKKELKKAKK